jgi:hypothetical protein
MPLILYSPRNKLRSDFEAVVLQDLPYYASNPNDLMYSLILGSTYALSDLPYAAIAPGDESMTDNIVLSIASVLGELPYTMLNNTIV